MPLTSNPAGDNGSERESYADADNEQNVGEQLVQNHLVVRVHSTQAAQAR